MLNQTSPCVWGLIWLAEEMTMQCCASVCSRVSLEEKAMRNRSLMSDIPHPSCLPSPNPDAGIRGKDLLRWEYA